MAKNPTPKKTLAKKAAAKKTVKKTAKKSAPRKVAAKTLASQFHSHITSIKKAAIYKKLFPSAASRRKSMDKDEADYLQELHSKKQNILGGAGSLIFIFAVLIITSMSAIAYVYYNLILETLAPQIAINATFIAGLLAEKLSYTTSNGVPLDELRGLQEFSSEFIGPFGSISHIVVTDAADTILHTVNLSDKALSEKAPDFVSPIITEGGATVGEVHLYMSIGAFQKVIDNLKYEMITLSIIALFLSVDLLNSFYVMRIYDPLTEIFNHLKKLCEGKFTRHLQLFQHDEVNALCQRINIFINRCNEKFSDFFYDAKETLDAQIDEGKSKTIQKHISSITGQYEFTGNQRIKPKIIQSAMSIKIPLLIFVMGQELSTAFLPVYFRQMENFTPLSSDFMVGLTFVGFICAPIISMYLSSHVLKFFSMRSYLIIGAAICMMTLYGLSQITSIEEAIILRSINGLGYGLIFLGSQVHIAVLSNSENRSRNSAVFARTMYAAVFFCPVIGGILAEQLGYQSIFVLSAVVCGLSILAMLLLMQGGGRKKIYPNDFENLGDTPEIKEVAELQPRIKKQWKSHYGIAILALFGSVPVKVIHFGIIMFIMPLFLVDAGFSVVEIGRVLMLFGFLLLVCMPYVGRYLDKHKSAKNVLMLGNILSLMAIVILFFDNSWLIILAVALFGVSQSMITPSLLTLVQNARLQGDISVEEYQVAIRENLTLFRMMERVGLIAAILLLSVFIGLGSYIYAFSFILVTQIISTLVLQMTPIKQNSDYQMQEEVRMTYDNGVANSKQVMEM